MFNLAVQLYSLREQAKLGMADVLKLVANFGFKGVEPAGFGDLTMADFKRATDDLGLEICSSHGPWCSSMDQINAVVDTAGFLGLKTACCGFGPNEFKDLDAIKATAERVNQMQSKLAESGITLFQHNHAWEFERIDGKLKYETYAALAPNVKFELDVYWSTNHGKECGVEMTRLFRDRTILLHIKDGVFHPDIPQLPLGQGKLPIVDVLKAADQSKVKWVVVELDNCVIDMYRGIKMSYQFMASTGLCAGKK